MRAVPLIVLGLLLAAGPSVAAPSLQENEPAHDEAEPRGDRWNDRWQGRRHYLYDDIARDAPDGHAANPQARCRNVPVRTKRSDGAFAIRRIKRCD